MAIPAGPPRFWGHSLSCRRGGRRRPGTWTAAGSEGRPPAYHRELQLSEKKTKIRKYHRNTINIILIYNTYKKYMKNKEKWEKKLCFKNKSGTVDSNKPYREAFTKAYIFLSLFLHLKNVCLLYMLRKDLMESTVHYMYIYSGLIFNNIKYIHILSKLYTLIIFPLLEHMITKIAAVPGRLLGK